MNRQFAPFIAFSILTLFVFCDSVAPASAQSVSYITQQSVNSAVQSVLQNIRDRIQTGQTASPPLAGNQPLQFTGDDARSQQYFANVFGPLAYADASLPNTKGPSLAPAPIPPQWGVWATGSGNWQRSTIAGSTTHSTAGTGIGGIDYTKIGVFSASDAIVIGINGSGTGLHSSDGTDATTPAVGAFAAYVNGQFSADFSFLAAFTDLNIPVAIAGYSKIDSYSYTGDLNYRFDLTEKSWIEPTVGLTYGNTFFDTADAITGDILTIQGGARVGTEFVLPDGIKVQPTVTGLAYSNVVESEGGISIQLPNGESTGAPAGVDKGQVWGKGDAKFNFVFTDSLSAYLEGSVYGTGGTFDSLGESAQGGVRYVF